MMLPSSNRKASLRKQYMLGVFAVVAGAAACFPFADFIGYRSVALILLMILSVLAMRLTLYPVLISAVLSALIWDFFFIPPHFTFTVANAEDALLLTMYFIIALLNGALTNQMKVYEKWTRNREEKENTLKLYNTLFNSISHELRTPIAAIWTASENLLEPKDAWSEDDRIKLTQEIHLAAKRLNRLIDNLLNVTRLESGFLKPKRDWCDINELIFSVVNDLEEDFQGRNVVVKIPENPPLVNLDHGLMEQVLFNLLYNSALYTPLEATIWVEAQFGESGMVLTIEDNGPGFPEEDLDRIFEKFYRTKGSKSGGTGLGLSIAKGFIDAHKGSIRFENRPEGGARFILDIPGKLTFVNTYPNE